MLLHNFYAHAATKFCKHVKHCQADLLGKQVRGGVVLRERFPMDNSNLQSPRHQNGAKEFVAGTCGESEIFASETSSYKSDCVKRPPHNVHVRKAADSIRKRAAQPKL